MLQPRHVKHLAVLRLKPRAVLPSKHLVVLPLLVATHAVVRVVLLAVLSPLAALRLLPLNTHQLKLHRKFRLPQRLLLLRLPSFRYQEVLVAEPPGRFAHL